MAENKAGDVVVCAKTGSVLWARDAMYVDGVPYRPECAPKGAVPYLSLPAAEAAPGTDVPVPAQTTVATYTTPEGDTVTETVADFRAKAK